MTRELSPAQRHKARVLAERAAADASPGGVTGGTAYELMLYKLANDCRNLKLIQSVSKKIERKAVLLPEYQDWIDGVLAAGKGGQDDVLTTLLVWHIDVGDYARALDMAQYAVEHELTLSDQYSRTIPTMLMDEFASAYSGGNLAEDPVQAVAVLTQVAALTNHCDAPDQARAKLYKATAYAMIAVMELTGSDQLTVTQIPQAEQAHGLLQSALKLFPGVGVKQVMERLRTRIAAAAP
ncbi:Phage terminase [Collimonas arenae]|uniref:Phage terminase n=1 Tax=Collimonas arenae TaxID=279058 RepID=A0A0A1FEP0_9BURK|nr:phage terminase small subunit [Collimonas arenae]AIY42981.1 Phage terminase [Collimonas arenae]